jgi:hypothetical protein
VRDCWYGDERDLVKWASLVHLAQNSRSDTILQVAFYRPQDEFPKLFLNNEGVPFPAAVYSHFRNLDHIKALEVTSVAGLRIEVFKDRFDGSHEYFAGLAKKIQQLHPRRLIVFLDPDTGIAPKRTGHKHVGYSELKDVFSELSIGDWLAFYQHRPRRKEWVSERRKEFADTLLLPPQQVTTFSSPLATDVVLFAAQKVPMQS